MAKIRFLIDDEMECHTQKGVLSAFAADLEKRRLGEVLKSSSLSVLYKWEDVTSESSRRLAVRVLALQPAKDMLTIFMPGHIVPGIINKVATQRTALTTRKFTTVANLDLFTIDNAHPEIELFQEFLSKNTSYECVSIYDKFSSTELDSGLISGGLLSVLKLTNRPWYSANSPERLLWLGWVKRAIEENFLDIATVEQDVRSGLVRPSLFSDVEDLLKEPTSPSLSDLTLDSIFVPPEIRVTESQYKLLHSKELQYRLVKQSKYRLALKSLKQKKFKDKKSFKLHQKFLKLTYKFSYFIYFYSVRPLVVRLRQRLGIR